MVPCLRQPHMIAKLAKQAEPWRKKHHLHVGIFILLLTLQSNKHIKSISEAFCNWRSRGKLHWCVCVCCHVFVAFLPAFFFRLKRWTAEEQHDLERSPVLQWDGGLLNCHSWDLSSMTSFNRWASSWLSPCGGGFLRSFLPASQQSAVVEPAAPWCVSGWLEPRACRSRRSRVGSIPSSIPVPNTRTFLQSPVELLHTCTASPCWNPALQSPFLLSRAVPRRAASGNAMTLYGFIQLLAAECSVVCAEEKELSTGWECHKVKL